jgi:pilus assembly protein CpaB
MQRRSVLLLSGCLALLTIVLLQAWKARIASEMGFYGEAAHILVATRDLPVGTVLAAGDLTAAEYPQRYLPPRSIGADLSAAVLGQTLDLTVRRGEPLLHSDWAPEAGTDKLSQRIPASLRGLALEVDAISTFSGLLEPGDRVDIVVT